MDRRQRKIRKNKKKKARVTSYSNSTYCANGPPSGKPMCDRPVFDRLARLVSFPQCFSLRIRPFSATGRLIRLLVALIILILLIFLPRARSWLASAVCASKSRITPRGIRVSVSDQFQVICIWWPTRCYLFICRRGRAPKVIASPARPVIDISTTMASWLRGLTNPPQPDHSPARSPARISLARQGVNFSMGKSIGPVYRWQVFWPIRHFPCALLCA